MATTAYDNDVFWRSGLEPRRLRRIGRRLRRGANLFDRKAQREIAAVAAALARHGEVLEPEPRR
jgi:hypothetical protein